MLRVAALNGVVYEWSVLTISETFHETKRCTGKLTIRWLRKRG